MKHYFAIKVNNKIVISATLLSNSIKIWINLKENEIKDPENRIRDVTNIGHHGVGNYELRITTEDDFYYFNMLFKQSYNKKI